MARPERPLDPSSGPVAAFAGDLRRLREAAGSPKYLQMARRTGRSRTALAEAAGGDHLPTWETVAAYVRACGQEPDAWLPRWERAKEEVQALRTEEMPSAGRSAPPPRSDDSARSGPARPTEPVHRPGSPEPAAGRRAADDDARTDARTDARIDPRDHPGAAPPPSGRHRRRWFAAGVLCGLVVGVTGTTAVVRPSPGDAGERRTPQMRTLALDSGSVSAMALSPFSAFATGDVAVSQPGTVTLWTADSGALVRRIPTRESGTVTVAFDPLDRDVLATGGASGLFTLWDTTNGRSLFSQQLQAPGPPPQIAFSPRVRGLMAVGGGDGTMTLWNSTTHRVETTLDTDLPEITAVAFDPDDESRIALASGDRVEIWDVGSTTRLMTLDDVPGTVDAMRYDPLTRNTLVMATRPRGLGVWDTTTGRLVRTMTDAGTVTSLDFNPQLRNSLATGDTTGHVTIWDPSNGTRVHDLPRRGSAVAAVRYAPDGRTLAVATAGSVTLWRVDDW